MRPRHLAAACAAAVMAVLAIALCCTVAATQGYAQQPPRHPYHPFTVEVEVWDAGASPWGRMERPLR